MTLSPRPLDSSDESLLRLLIERGADLKAAGPVPLAIAQYAQCEKCIDVLIAGAKPEIISMGALSFRTAEPGRDGGASVVGAGRGRQRKGSGWQHPPDAGRQLGLAAD